MSTLAIQNVARFLVGTAPVQKEQMLLLTMEFTKDQWAKLIHTETTSFD